jgi:glycosyltransferase involved in cell wall biosynthesis
MVSVIIPIFNEEEVLLQYEQKLFPAIDSLSQTFKKDFEIVCVDDGSVDKSYHILQELQRNRSLMVVDRNKQNLGMGAAIRRGIAGSHGELLIFLDADLTFKPEEMGNLLEEYSREPCDCISGSPYLTRGLMEDVQPFRKVLSLAVNLLYRLELGRGITSVSPIFRLYRREVFSHISLTSNKYEVNAEILAKMILGGMKVREVPAHLYRRECGYSKAHLTKSVRNHVTILYKIFRVKYLHGDWN